MSFKKAGIVGLGLIGGSLAKALKSRAGVEKIVAVNRNEDVLKLAYSEGVISEYATDITDIFRGCDIVFLCTPVDILFEYAKKLVPFLDADCIVTDVGSTKKALYEKMNLFSDNFLYIGGHPMTGSEKFRYQASKEHLFENAYYIIVPGSSVPNQKVLLFRKLISNIGAIPLTLSSSEHDHIAASISHVPHIMAASLVNLVKQLDSEKEHMHLLAAGGFKDITRIASSSPDMWKSVCFENKEEIISVLNSLEMVISNMKSSLEKQDEPGVYDFFNQARLYRDSFSSVTPGRYSGRFEINVDVLDKPGSIAIITVLFSSNAINIKNLEIVNNRESDNGALLISFASEEERQKSIKLLREMNYEVSIKE